MTEEDKLLILLEAYRAGPCELAARNLGRAMREVDWSKFRRFRNGLADFVENDALTPRQLDYVLKFWREQKNDR